MRIGVRRWPRPFEVSAGIPVFLWSLALFATYHAGLGLKLLPPFPDKVQDASGGASTTQPLRSRTSRPAQRHESPITDDSGIFHIARAFPGPAGSQGRKERLQGYGPHRDPIWKWPGSDRESSPGNGRCRPAGRRLRRSAHRQHDHRLGFRRRGRTRSEGSAAQRPQLRQSDYPESGRDQLTAP